MKKTKQKNKDQWFKVRCSPQEKARWKVMAKIYAGGNMSLWFRHAMETAERRILK